MILKLGSTGEDVKVAQITLKYLGLLATVDGDFGPLTESAVRRFQRAKMLADDGVIGPKTWDALLKAAPAEIPETPTFKVGTFLEGWYSEAIKHPIHTGRWGGQIVSRCTVVHTTDMRPGLMSALLKSWTSSAGVPPRSGVGAHFLLGRQPAEDNEENPSGGLVQMTPITRNGNHAGGGGSFVKADRTVVHPNRVAIGIEIDCAGYLGRRTPVGTWVHKDSGTTIAESDVYVDERGKGWHKVTDYQFAVLDALLRALDAHQTPVWPGLYVAPKGGYQANGVTWGAITGARVVGHVTLNPTDKSDPGPQTMEWLRKRT